MKRGPKPKPKKPKRNRDIKGRYVNGHEGEGGRKLGSRNKITNQLRDAILLAAMEVGGFKKQRVKGFGLMYVPTNKGGVLAFLKSCAIEDPVRYAACAIGTRLGPKTAVTSPLAA